MIPLPVIANLLFALPENARIRLEGVFDRSDPLTAVKLTIIEGWVPADRDAECSSLNRD